MTFFSFFHFFGFSFFRFFCWGGLAGPWLRPDDSGHFTILIDYLAPNSLPIVYSYSYTWYWFSFFDYIYARVSYPNPSFSSHDLLKKKKSVLWTWIFRLKNENLHPRRTIRFCKQEKPHHGSVLHRKNPFTHMSYFEHFFCLFDPIPESHLSSLGLFIVFSFFSFFFC